MFGLFELIGESIDPGPVGSIECASPEVKRRSFVIVLLHFNLAVALLVAACVGIVLGTWGHGGWMTFWFCALAIYLIFAHYFIPVPDTSNMGWLGGIFDNPFRYSDDLNWMLLTLKVLLYPGHLITVGLRDGYLAMTGQLPPPRRRKRKHKQATSFEQHQTGEGL